MVVPTRTYHREPSRFPPTQEHRQSAVSSEDRGKQQGRGQDQEGTETERGTWEGRWAPRTVPLRQLFSPRAPQPHLP